MRPRKATIDVLCAGQPREFGFALGQQLRGQIQQAQRALGDYEVFRRQQPWWCPYSLFRMFAEREARQKLEPDVVASYPDLSPRLEGMAEGAGVSLDTLYLFQALELPPAVPEGVAPTAPPHAACSAVALTGSRSAAEAPLLAHNFDCMPLIADLLVLRENRGQGHLRSLTMTAAPLSGAAGGMNEAGLAISYNSVVSTDEVTRFAPISLAVDRALSHCTSVAEACELISETPRCGGAALMMADAHGEIAALELSSSKQALRRNDEGQDFLFHSNRYRSPAMQDIQVSGDAHYDRDAPAALVGERIMQSPEYRDQRLEQRLLEMPPADAARLSQLMADHGPERQGSPDTICMHGEYWSTSASLQFEPRRRTMRLAYGPACTAEPAEFQL